MKRAATFVVLALSGTLSGCFSVGPRQLKADQVDYARALGDAKKRQILATIVGLRYADAPAFLNVSQVIAAYTFDATGGAVANSQPDPAGPAIGATGMVSYSNHPTFTFTPTTGEAYASAYIRPLAPTLVLPLAGGGIPIDLLLRITTQSIGGLQNGTMLGGPQGGGSPGFFELLQALRRLQLAGEMTVHYRETNHVGQVSMVIGKEAGGESPETAPDVERVTALLHLSSSKTREYDIVYGEAAPGGNQIAMVTRSVLAILTDLGAEIEVPAADVAAGATKPSVDLVGGETRPTIVVHTGKRAPAGAYVAITYGSLRYWIDRTDFDSKYAFTVLQNIMALAEINQDSKAPIVTIPAS